MTSWKQQNNHKTGGALTQVAVKNSTYTKWYLAAGVLNLVSGFFYLAYNQIERYFPEKNPPVEEKVVVPKKMPLVWAANGDNVDSEEVEREPEMNDFWTEAYQNGNFVIEMPRMKKLQRRITHQMQFWLL